MHAVRMTKKGANYSHIVISELVHIGVTLVTKVDEQGLGPHVLVEGPMPPIG